VSLAQPLNQREKFFKDFIKFFVGNYLLVAVNKKTFATMGDMPPQLCKG
jgi:hypothetical protein